LAHSRLAEIVLLLGVSLVLGCSTTGSSEPAFAEVSWVDLERGIESTLVSRGFENFDELRRDGRLDPSIKVVEPEDMGDLVAVLREHRFFERASNLSPEAPELRDLTTQIIWYRDAQGVSTLPYHAGSIGDPERMGWNQDFIQIKTAIIAVYRNTVQFTLAPESGEAR